MIEVCNVSRDFKKIIKEPGLKGSIKALFNPKYDISHAVDSVSFSVPDGQILGFIGPNGAGKSTMIKMLTGILTPTSGFCRINGFDPQKERKNYVKEIGVVFGQRTQLWWDLPLTETYSVLKEIYGLTQSQFNERMAFLTDTLDLNPFIKSPVRTLSLGQRMRADIAASLLHNPKVLFLDEPTIGLDIVVKDSIRKAIMDINRTEKTTIILTTHDLSDIELLCKRIVLIDKGKIVYDGDLSHIKESFGRVREFSCVFENVDDADKVSPENLGVPKHPDLQITKDKKQVSVRFDSTIVSLPNMISGVLSKGKASDISVKDIDIEEILRRVYTKKVEL